MSRRKKNKGGAQSRQRRKEPPTVTIAPLPLDSSEKVYKLTISLKSDLCPGSGDGFSSGIDSDICFDAEGMPVLPGRRIKGCLRGAALEVYPDSDDLITLVFGASGSGTGGLVSVSTACMENAESYGGQQATLDHYTYTRAQTSIDPRSGAAQENTLRFIRVIRQYREGGSVVRFVAPITVNLMGIDEGRQQEVENLLTDAALALRNIGLGRNRGFGAVRCKLDPLPLPEKVGMQYLRIREVAGERVALSYRVHLEAPIMLSQQSGTRSTTYIPGSSVFGFLARKLRVYGGFDELFFGSNLYCSPLYLIDSEGDRCLPASPFVVKVKGGSHDGQFMNARDYERLANREPEAWGTPKPLRDGFISPTTWQSVKVDTQTLYHHSTVGEGTLYTQTCINEGQDFAGYIECSRAHAAAIAAALTSGKLSFGRSKSAQYATCSLVENPKDYASSDGTTRVAKGSTYALLLESDTLVVGEQANHATDHDTLEDALRNALTSACGDAQPFALCDAADGSDHPITNIRTTLITGYNAKWNQKRPHTRAYAAGSCVVFKAQTNCAKVPIAFRIGERQSEGFGQVRLIDLAKVRPQKQAQASSASASAAEGALEQLRIATIGFAENHRSKLCADPFVASFVGRVALMVRESSTEEAFDERLDSIKDEKKRKEAKSMCADLRTHLQQDGAEQPLTWEVHRECLGMLFRLAKYYLKQKDGKEAANGR